MPKSPIELIFGPMLVGILFNAMLYGVMVVQSFIYYMTYTRDATWIRYFVLYLVVVETINSGCVIGLIYEPLILRFGSPDALTYFPTMLASAPIVTVAISTPIQIFTAWRITIISNTKIMGGIIAVFALVSFGGGLWTAVDVITFRFFAEKPQLNRPGAVWFIASAVADVLITASLIFNLARRKTGFSSTDSAINRIIRLTIQTGLITSVFAMADLISFLVSPETAISFIWDFSLSKLYSNALLSTLNARLGWSNLNTSGQLQDNVLFGSELSTTLRSREFNVPSTTRFAARNLTSTRGPETFELESGQLSKDEVHVTITKQTGYPLQKDMTQ